MIRTTHAENDKWVVSAYSDNAAVLEGPGLADGSCMAPSRPTGEWQQKNEDVYHVIKIETHNHPTAISPYPGAATVSLQPYIVQTPSPLTTFLGRGWRDPVSPNRILSRRHLENISEMKVQLAEDRHPELGFVDLVYRTLISKTSSNPGNWMLASQATSQVA